MASTAHVGESRALVFPVMCNGYLQLDYSESNTSNYKHNLWGHKDEGFTFEAIVSPYDVNGIGHRTSGQGRLDSIKTPPSPNLSLDDHADTTSNYQSVSYFGSGRNTHKMMLFHNPYFQFYLENTTSSNFNQPAEYKLVCKLISGSKTHTIESDAVITSSNRLKGYYDSGGFYENGGLVSTKTQLSTSANAPNEQATITIGGNLNSFTNTEAVPVTLGTGTIEIDAVPSSVSGAMDTAGSSGTAATAKITFSTGWSITPMPLIAGGFFTAANNNNAVILRNRQTGTGASANKTYRFFITDTSSSGNFPSAMQGSGAEIKTFSDLVLLGVNLEDLNNAGYVDTDVFVPITGADGNIKTNAPTRYMLTAAINLVNGSGSNPSSGLDITATTTLPPSGTAPAADGVITLAQDAVGAAGNNSTTPNTGPVIGSSIANGGKLAATTFGDNSSDTTIVVGTDATSGTTVDAKITIAMRGTSGSLQTRLFKFVASGVNGQAISGTSPTVYRVRAFSTTNATATSLRNAINTVFGAHSQFDGTQAAVGTGSNANVVTITSPATGTQSNQSITKTSNYNSVVTIGSNPFSNFVAGSSAVTPTAFITITDSAGNVVRYKPSKGQNGESTGSTGTENSGVTYFLNDASSTTNTATNLRTAIASPNGHAQFSPAMNASSSSNVVTVSATAPTGSHALARTSNMTSVTLSSFSGGAGNAFSVSSGEADGIGAGNQVFNNVGVLVGTVSSVSGNNITLTAAPATPITSTMYVSQPREALYLEQLNKVSCSFDKRHVNLYLNNVLVQKKKLDIENFEFDDVDCYIGQDGSNTNTQFMGELYEVTMHKGLQPCATISTLTPNFGDTLFYYTFGD